MFCIQASRPRTAIATKLKAAAPVAEERLACERRQDLGDRAGGEQEDDQVGAGEEDVGDVLVEQRRAALAGVEEDPVEVPVDLRHHQHRDHRRADDQQDVGDHGCRPRERGHPPPGQPGRAQPAHGDDQVDREADEAEDRQRRCPAIQASTPLDGEKTVSESGGRATVPPRGGVEERAVDGQRADQVEPVGELVQARQGDAAGADLQRARRRRSARAPAGSGRGRRR